jgi:hypothetical protein
MTLSMLPIVVVVPLVGLLLVAVPVGSDIDVTVKWQQLSASVHGDPWLSSGPIGQIFL